MNLCVYETIRTTLRITYFRGNMSLVACSGPILSNSSFEGSRIPAYFSEINALVQQDLKLKTNYTLGTKTNLHHFFNSKPEKK